MSNHGLCRDKVKEINADMLTVPGVVVAQNTSRLPMPVGMRLSRSW